MENRANLGFPKCVGTRSAMTRFGGFLVVFFMTIVLFAPGSFAQALPGGTLDPVSIPKFVEPLIIPPVMPAKGIVWDRSIRKLVPYYEIEVVQFEQQILPTVDELGGLTGLQQTTVWSYGAVDHPETRNYPAFTIENLEGVPTRIKWVNNLVDENGDYLPHLLPVDQSLHWANPGQLMCMDGSMSTDCRPMQPPQTRYTGPVPIITHVHGAHVQPDSDGYPEAWYLPNANNIPLGYATHGKLFGQIPGAPVEPGAAVFQYRNDQPETTLWYHDHTLGMTRTNVYAGPAGFFMIRDPKNVNLRIPGPAPLPGTDPNGNALVRRLVREIPIVVQDRSFNADGSLFYPDNRAFFEILNVPGQPEQFPGEGILDILFAPQSDVAPIWNPEFFGNTLVVNGRTWPQLDVERRKYRLRLLNGSDSRFLILRFENEALTFHQIGSDQGFLPAPVPQTRLLLGPAERADVIVDFSDLPTGSRIVLENIGPDEPFGGGVPCVDGLVLDVNCDFLPSDPATTGVVMAFDIGRRPLVDLSRIPASLPAEGDLPASSNTRQVSLNEEMSVQVCMENQDGNLVQVAGSPPDGCPEGSEPFGPTAAKLGTLSMGNGVALLWENPITENPPLGSTETWEIYNFTADAHPIHLHLVRFKVLERQGLEVDEEGVALQPAMLIDDAIRGPEPWEVGYKDTVIAYPGEVTRIAATFDIAGLYVWHCHILEHEDNEMMRPYCVGTPGMDGPANLCGDIPINPDFMPMN